MDARFIEVQVLEVQIFDNRDEDPKKQKHEVWLVVNVNNIVKIANYGRQAIMFLEESGIKVVYYLKTTYDELKENLLRESK